MLFRHVEQRSFLHTVNPMVKFAAIVLAVIALTLVREPAPTGFVALLALLLVRIGGRIPLGRVLRSIWPFLGFAFGLAWMNIFFPRNGGDILWAWGPLRVTASSLSTGVTLGMRVVAIVLFSYLFAATTDPRDLALSMVQQAHLPYRLAYGLFAGFRFLPLLQSELEIIRQAHRMRGVGRRRGWRGRWEEAQRLLVPLFAVVIRRAMHIGIAMESRGFGAYDRRTYLHETRVTKKDMVFLGLIVVAIASGFWLLANLGLLTYLGPQWGTPYQQVG